MSKDLIRNNLIDICCEYYDCTENTPLFAWIKNLQDDCLEVIALKIETLNNQFKESYEALNKVSNFIEECDGSFRYIDSVSEEICFSQDKIFMKTFRSYGFRGEFYV